MKAINITKPYFQVSCCENEMIEAVASKMFLSGANFLPVIDANKNHVGNVTYLDICLGPTKKAKPKNELRVFEVMNQVANRQ